jgi:hypothetical protein
MVGEDEGDGKDEGSKRITVMVRWRGQDGEGKNARTRMRAQWHNMQYCMLCSHALVLKVGEVWTLVGDGDSDDRTRTRWGWGERIVVVSRHWWKASCTAAYRNLPNWAINPYIAMGRGMGTQCYSSRAILGPFVPSLPFPPFTLTTFLTVLAPLTASKPIWVCTVTCAMLLLCSGSLANAVCSLPSWYGSYVEPFFSFDILHSCLVSTFLLPLLLFLLVSHSYTTFVDDTFLSRE